MAEDSASVVEEVAEAVKNGTAKVPATQEGMIIAYSSLVIMALIPIWFGSFRSVESQKEQKENHEKTGEKPETMTQKDAMMFPLIASCALFGLYMIFNIFGKEYINLLLSFYFLVLGIFALAHMVSPAVLRVVPSAVPLVPFHLQFTQGEGEAKETVLDYQFNTHDLVSVFPISVPVFSSKIGC